MRVNFSVTNQLATPAIHAAALANRPPAGQPGRLFVDTDNPSSGIYRDTGTVWENITGGASAGNLQTVTDAGNTTDNNILLTYPDNTLANALVFYNDQLAQEEYLIEKRGTGITTNDSLAIQSRGNISPSTNPVGFLIDGANDIIKTFYTTSYTTKGLLFDFVNDEYYFGNVFTVNDKIEIVGGVITIGNNIRRIEITNDPIIKTIYNNNDIGLNLDFTNGFFRLGDISSSFYFETDTANQKIQTVFSGTANGLIIDYQGLYYALGDYNQSTYGTHIYIENSAAAVIKTLHNGNQVGIKLDFANILYQFGGIDGFGNYIEVDDNGSIVRIITQGNRVMFEATQTYTTIGDVLGVNNGTNFGVDDTGQTLTASGGLLVGTSGPVSGQHLKIRINGTDYVIELKDP